MSTITSRQRFQTTIAETFSAEELPAIAAASRALSYDQFNGNVVLGPSTTPPATKAWTGILAGDQTLDLTALSRAVGNDVDATGLKLRQILVNNLSASAVLTIAPGASDPYEFNGTGGEKAIPAGGKYQEYFADGLGAVGPTHKTLDITIAAAQTYQIALVFGA
jgi:hypothetical protein